MKHYLSPTNEIFAYELDGSQDHIIPSNFRAITYAEAETLRTQKLQELFVAKTYVEKRAAEYPQIKDQLDTLYHGGYDAWKASIKTIKDKYPKA
jgi:hypothetical protein